ncbi:MAG TPA: DUF2017 family protein [Candidatus Dormibacteraeota bacterium]|nr:DUF2017 family protein [Candidatus Dormibacteraeota bacterium]
MAAIERRRGRIEVELDDRERQVLIHIVDDLRAGLGTEPRTVPRAYDDPLLEDEYRRLTRPEVEGLRTADVDGLREALTAGGDRCRLDEDAALAWLRALNHLRLVAGGRLGLEEDGWEETLAGPEVEGDDYAMLVTLGWLQDAIIAAIDG